jgi:hypothetical protein
MEEEVESEPSDKQISDWYVVIGRIISIERSRSSVKEKAYCHEQLREDVKDCVDRGFIIAVQTSESRKREQLQLMVTEKGMIVFDMMHAHLVATGQTDGRGDDESTQDGKNPFDGMD